MKMYQDRAKIWIKDKLKNINFFHQLSFETLEEIYYKAEFVKYEEGHKLFEKGNKVDKIYDGGIQTYVAIDDEDVKLDNLRIAGCTLCQYTALMGHIIGYSAKVISE
jgi:hypothetical protein